MYQNPGDWFFDNRLLWIFTPGLIPSGGFGAISNTRPHSGLDYVCSGRAEQRKRSEEETEKANGHLWRGVVWERKFSAPDFEIAAGDSRCAEVFSPWSVLRCFLIEKLHGWSWRHWCFWRSCSFFVIAETCTRSPILLLLMSAAVCDHVDSHSVLLSNSVASRGKSGRVLANFSKCSILGLARNSCVLHRYSLC
jgi:hypothetical protein